MEKTNRKPVQVFKARGISASVFENETKKGESFYKICLQRTYWDGEAFQTSDSYGRDDVPLAMSLMQQAWQYVIQAEEADKKKASEEK